MSTLAATKSDNFYYHPDYRPEHGSINKFHNSHPLGTKAKRLREAVILIRFEMPWKVICLKCRGIIAKGVRFNAEKRRVGCYLSTNIYEFGMKCCFCDNWLRVTTDPRNAAYVLSEGIRLQVNTFGTKEAETVKVDDTSSSNHLDPIAHLEKEITTIDSKSSELSTGTDLIKQVPRYDNGNDFMLNQLLRKRHRTSKTMDSRSKNTLLEKQVNQDFADIDEVKFCGTSTLVQQLIRRIRTKSLKSSYRLRSRSKRYS